MMQIEKINAFYGSAQILKEVSITVEKGKLIAVIGANGAGKSTLMKCITGLIKPREGSISFEGDQINGFSPNKIVERGIVLVPEGRMLFPKMTVAENLEMGAYLLKSKDQFVELKRTVFELFPILEERKVQIANTLSGGEQQMLAIGRGLMAAPNLLMLDEPSLGLAPKLVDTIFEMITHINEDLGISILLVEQNVHRSCRIADRAYVVENGEIVLEDDGIALLENDHVRKAYLGL